jgi:hypothetical protein
MFNKLDPSANEIFARKNRAHSITIEISSNVSWAIEVTQVLLTTSKTWVRTNTHTCGYSTYSQVISGYMVK